MTERPTYPGFLDPEDWREAPSLRGWPEQALPRVQQVVEDATADHTAKHQQHDHPWCRWCVIRQDRDESPEIKTAADLMQWKAALVAKGLTTGQISAFAKKWGGEIPNDLLADMCQIPAELVDELVDFAHQLDHSETLWADAQRNTYARALRYLDLHRDPPKEQIRPRDDLPSFVSLTEFLEQPDEPEQYRIEGLWPIEGRVVFAAQYKAGKSTTVGNVLRSLADGTPFLDEFTVNEFDGRIALIDNELSPKMLRRWLRDQGIVNTELVELVSLRGKVGTFDLLDPATRAAWAERLRAADATVVVLDCLRPVLDSLGLSEDKDAGRFLVAFDALLAEAFCGEGMVVHHAGHNGERSRGDSRLRDWPDVEWTLAREKGQDGEDDRSGPRYFRAYGRDVDQHEGQLLFDEHTRHLSWAGASRKDAASDRLIPALVAYLEDNPGASGRAIETGMGEARTDVRNALRRAIGSGLVITKPGPKRAILHFANPSAPSAPPVRGRTESECASAPIGGALHSHTQTEQCAPAHSLEIGPCTSCQQPTRRYGTSGSPTCQDCLPVLTSHGVPA